MSINIPDQYLSSSFSYNIPTINAASMPIFNSTVCQTIVPITISNSPIAAGWQSIPPLGSNGQVLTWYGSTFGWVPTAPINPTPDTTSASEKENTVDSKGCVCKKCKAFDEYWEPNQEDGTFICYVCRSL